MKVLILHPSSRYDRYLPDIPAAGRMELVFTDREGPEERWLAAGGDAEALVAAPVTPVTEELIARMPHLKLIHSDGVGYDRIDLAAAREGGIYVCNCAGCNAGPVAELAVTLMSMLLHRTLWGDRMVRAGQQHEAVNELAAHVPEDLSTCRVGLVGFGAIGQATAQRLRANGSEVFYYAGTGRIRLWRRRTAPGICPCTSWRRPVTSSASICPPRRRAPTCWTGRSSAGCGRGAIW